MAALLPMSGPGGVAEEGPPEPRGYARVPLQEPLAPRPAARLAARAAGAAVLLSAAAVACLAARGRLEAAAAAAGAALAPQAREALLVVQGGWPQRPARHSRRAAAAAQAPAPTAPPRATADTQAPAPTSPPPAPTPAPTPGPTPAPTAAPAPAACAASGEQCLESRCCAADGERCYRKDGEFAGCLRSCAPGVHDGDAEPYRTPWSCEALGERKEPGAWPHANAGCFIVGEDGRLMLLRHGGYLDTWDIPGGTTEGDEPPQETATRETFEETGYRATAKELMQVMPNGFHIFRCELAESQPSSGLDPHEVAEVSWFYEPDIPGGPWRFPEEQELYRSWMIE